MAIKIAGQEVIDDNKQLVLAKLKEVDATIEDTAVDVFVYDTRKDSDGGAWRKRTQHTSWYNETLNTSIRGSRREFPAVAVIVLEAETLTIYDGDDPSLPMWMVFSSGSWSHGIPVTVGSTHTARGLAISNGMFAWGTSSASGSDGALIRANFIADYGLIDSGGGWSYTFNVTVNISQRNNTNTNTAVSGGGTLVDANVNDVAMTVLPNAPIDTATGLPVPTIAVATDGGVSVIKDDGTVIDRTTPSYPADFVMFNNDNDVVASFRAGSGDAIITYPIANLTDDQSYAVGYSNWIRDGGWSVTKQFERFRPVDLVSTGTDIVFGDSDSNRLVLHSRETQLMSGQLGEGSSSAYKAFISSTYNTGWQSGDIKLATLSDTDDTDLVGSELVDEASDLYSQFTTGEWTIGVGSASVTNLSGNDRLFIAPDGGFIPQGKYVVTFDVLTTDTGFNGLYYNGTYYVHFPSVGSYSTTIDFNGSVNPFFYVSSGDTVSIDNISVRLAEPDRSVNNNSLQVFGTVTKTPVASGADLVAYSGFNASSGTAPTNYLLQPYNSDLEFGTGDFSVMGWFKTSDASVVRNIVSRYITSAPNDTFSGFNISILTDGTLYFYTMEGNANSTTPTSGQRAVDDDRWHHFVGIRRSSGNIQVYVDGKSYSSANATVRNINVSSQQSALRFGWHYGNDQYSIENLALLRISATTPSEEQIKKIYEDEKVLFQENAKVTLYGTSDAVTALAYDDNTEVLHVGTSSGRSDFKGLRRVNNTTDAVGTAISASNGMIVEE